MLCRHSSRNGWRYLFLSWINPANTKPIKTTKTSGKNRRTIVVTSVRGGSRKLLSRNTAGKPKVTTRRACYFSSVDSAESKALQSKFSSTAGINNVAAFTTIHGRSYLRVDAAARFPCHSSLSLVAPNKCFRHQVEVESNGGCARTRHMGWRREALVVSAFSV